MAWHGMAQRAVSRLATRQGFLISCACVSLIVSLGACQVFLRHNVDAIEASLVALTPTQTVRVAVERNGSQPRSVDVDFVLRNSGGQVARIRSVDSGCGCAVPSVQPTVVLPGGSSTVRVSATPPPAGERRVRLLLHSDAPLTPQVALELVLISEKQPPFVLAVQGDLAFFGRGSLLNETRPLHVHTVESKGSNQAPSVRTDLAFLRIARKALSEKRSADPYVERIYEYTVGFLRFPPERTFRGTVYVDDPWNGGPPLAITVSGRSLPSLRVAPSQLRLSSSPRRHGSPAAKFFVVSDRPRSRFRVDVDDSLRPLLSVRPLPADDGGCTTLFEVRLHNNAVRLPEQGSLTIIDADSPSDQGSLLVSFD
jgi:hypothetical protein